MSDMEYITKEAAQKCLDDLSSDNLIGNENDTFISLAEAKDKIEELPTADVVPKSEVENLKVLLEMQENAYESLKELYDVDTEALIKAREKTEVEVAREIFEEIETCMKDFEDDDDGYLLKKCEFEFFMREIKKEYT